MVSRGGNTVETRAVHGFRLCLARPPSALETQRLVELFTKAREQYSADPKKALTMATKPLGPGRSSR